MVLFYLLRCIFPLSKQPFYLFSGFFIWFSSLGGKLGVSKGRYPACLFIFLLHIPKTGTEQVLDSDYETEGGSGKASQWRAFDQPGPEGTPG